MKTIIGLGILLLLTDFKTYKDFEGTGVYSKITIRRIR